MKALIAIMLSVFVVSCANKNDATPAQTTNVGQYSYMNGSCYDSVNRQYVSSNYCANVMNTNSGYQMNNGICVSTTTGQQVAPGYCTSTNSGYYSNNGYCFMSSTNQQVDNSYCSTNTNTGGQCYGIYYYNGQTVQCSGANCRGYTLIQVTTGTSTLCQ